MEEVNLYILYAENSQLSSPAQLSESGSLGFTIQIGDWKILF